MKLKAFIFSILTLLVFVMPANARNTYNTAWEKINQFEKKSLPSSALTEVNKIFDDAVKTKNNPQVIKALIHKMKFQSEISHDDWPLVFPAVEKLITESNDAAEKAMLHSLLAEMYMKYYNGQAYLINQRTSVEGYIPESMDEWSANIFINKFYEHIQASLTPAADLQKQQATAYSDILILGEDSRNLRPTLFDFLSHRALDLLKNNEYQIFRIFQNKEKIDDSYFAPANEFIHIKTSDNTSLISITTRIYQSLLAFHLNDKTSDALLHCDLSRIEYIYSISLTEKRNDLYMNYLSSLEDKYKNSPLCVEIMAAQANYYISNENTAERTSQSISEQYTKAYDICRKGISSFASYKRIGLLKNILKTIEQPSLNCYTTSIAYPNTEINFSIRFKNLTKATLKIYKVEKDIVNHKNTSSQTKITGKLISTQPVELKDTLRFTEQELKYSINGLDYGIYQYELVPENTDAKNFTTETNYKGEFYVSKYALLKQKTNNNTIEYYVVDSKSGHPQSNVSVQLYESKYENNKNVVKLLQTLPVNNDGYVNYAFEKNLNILTGITSKNDNDAYFPLSNHYVWKTADTDKNQSREEISLFTDRSIYRPGQTVYFKGIAVNKTTTDVSLLKGKEYTVKLYDSNNKEIAQKALKSNDFGSFSSEFILPQQVLTGYFSIECNNYRQIIQVEEYKRPSIDVSFNKLQNIYAFGDSIALSGNVINYSGYASQNAQVKYRITKGNIFWRFNYIPDEVANGTVSTNENGDFTIPFIPKKDFKDKKQQNIVYHYTLTIETTDSKGETQEESYYFNVSDNSILLHADVNNIIRKNDDKVITVKATNYDNEKVTPFVEYQIFRLQKDSFDDEYKAEGEELIKGGIDLSETDKIYYSLFKGLPSGMYRMVFTAKEDKATTEELHRNEVKYDFYLYDVNDSKLQEKTNVFIDPLKTECTIGEDAEIMFGTAHDNVKVLYRIVNKDKLFESKWVDFNNELKKIKIPYKKEYGNKVSVSLLFIKDGKEYNKVVNLTQKTESTDLDIKFTTFRDKLLPGQQEEWTVKITDSKGKIVNAEFLATMYDASLDAFAKNTWNFNPGLLNADVYYYPNWDVVLGNLVSSSVYFNTNAEKIQTLKFDALNWFGLNFSMRSGGGIYPMGNGEVRKRLMYDGAPADLTGAIAVADESLMENSTAVVADTVANTENGNLLPIRENFNETAFFYPQLKTNKNGEVLISFKIPESLTRWNFMGLAHTADLKTGQINAFAVTQKSLMITANMPRFVRIGDKLTLTAEVVNMTDKAMNGQATLELINPADNKVVFSKSTNFSTAANGTLPVSWNYDIPSEYDMLICKFTAQSKEFSDGEQHMLPVLSNKLLVTESMPLNVTGKGSYTFTFDRMQDVNSPTLENKRFTVEFSSNPAWYAVQALPYLSNPASENAVSYFSAYYTNTLAAHIANSNPAISATFDKWKSQGGTSETLISNLDKNQELKNIVLEESPWVMDAKNETEQKQQIALLFDLNNLKNNTSTVFGKLKEMQLPNGAFPWFTGMSEDRYVTHFVLDGMAQLKKLNVLNYTQDEINMQQSAIKYIDQCIKNDLEQLKKSSKSYKTENHLSSTQIYYHYIRSAYDMPVADGAKEAFNYYIQQMEQQWTKQGLYEQAMIAIVMHRSGKKNIANDIIKSLRERSTTNEMGMYWDKNRNGYLWNQSAVSTQVMLINAFDEIAGNATEVDYMKLWLLKQKQVQKWDTEIASVNAVYALLKQGGNWLGNKNDATITVGGTTLTEKAEAGTGYIKKSYEAREITPETGKITISTNNEGIAWGAAYWQYFENIDNIEKQQGELSVDKKLFVEKLNSNGKYLEPLLPATPLKAGDRITVRLTVRTDRDLEYVCLKDLRGACFEPVDKLSGYRYKGGIGYYQSIRDASVQYFFNSLRKGTYVFEYSVFVTRAGEYSNGTGTIQCQYAPEFISHSNSDRITISK